MNKMDWIEFIEDIICYFLIVVFFICMAGILLIFISLICQFIEEILKENHIQTIQCILPQGSIRPWVC
jgi:hypothetical protein